jgi:putative addiction module component (TIGR02574 family)
MMTQAQLLPEIFRLSTQDQVMIVEAIRNHLGGGIEPVDEEEFKRELERRVTHARENPGDDVPLDEVMQRLRKGR